MRVATRLLANVKGPRILESYQPTGLTGLLTHPSPRSTLLYTYNATLEKLQKFPESSVYRKSTEALTRKRLKVVEAHTPIGFEQWQTRAEEHFKNNPKELEKLLGTKSLYNVSELQGKIFLMTQDRPEPDPLKDAWSGTKPGTVLEGTYTEEEKQRAKHFDTYYEGGRGGNVSILDEEPQLNVDQIAAIEQEIGAGLIEEIIQVAQGELGLAQTLADSQVWEDLEERPVEGQWKYFEREGTKGTQ
ncbi:MAG: hypothetical protein M1814_001695 [Vezdaea aestivalis]|nr:MAG: hypothetical protein M1814_001695 [Vezdaea aestivalis]